MRLSFYSNRSKVSESPDHIRRAHGVVISGEDPTTTPSFSLIPSFANELD
ncbi:hypothetical protein BVRB_5g109780 [Beta vulgaris subsp. vulgaris]|nr:hypothetical protein BVRB_5g109780 [Beta vulgaris subsp. vulgaris]